MAALLGVLVMVVATVTAQGAPAPAAPTLTSWPPNPTGSMTAAFGFSPPPADGSNRCRLDAGAFETCTTATSQTYAGISSGSHTFQVQALVGGKTSSATSYTWVVDATPPGVSFVSRVGASPTNAPSLSWTVTFSEPVTGVDATDFGLVKTGVSGGSSTVTVSGSGATYTASIASTGTGDGTIGLNVVDDDSIVDVVGNKLGGMGGGNGAFVGQAFAIDKTGPANAPTVTSGPMGLVSSTAASFVFSSGESGVAAFRCQLDGGGFTICSTPKAYSGLTQGPHTFQVRAVDALVNPGPPATRSWTVDTVAPTAPTLTEKPGDPNGSAISTFAWPPSEPGLTYECSLENGPFEACTSPFTFEVIVDTSNNGQHQFGVRAIDQAGNVGPATTYTWKVDPSVRFTISGNAQGLLYPGGPAALRLNLTITNPNNFAIEVTSLTVWVQTVVKAPSAPAGPCSASDYQVTGYTGPGFDAPSGTTTLSADGVTPAQMPSIRMVNRQDAAPGDGSGNQDGCKGAMVKLSYAGTAAK